MYKLTLQKVKAVNRHIFRLKATNKNIKGYFGHNNIDYFKTILVLLKKIYLKEFEK